ncbi:hypothetical protein ACJJI5_12365 [Microbulbifer sp. EKSA008]|uniref:hypothetical protein n=1 Tax=Microbulbifer sp. EKSA008 TaxID=3243367 RepID=UPI0040414FF4
MNPAALLSTGGGGFSGSSGVTDQSSTAATSSTGIKNIGAGSNPHIAGRAAEKIFTSPIFLLSVVLVVFLLLKMKK